MTADTLQLISLISFIAAGVFLIIALFLFIYLKIPRVIGDLSGRTARRNIAKLRSENEKGGAKAFRPSKVNLERGPLTETENRLNKPLDPNETQTMEMEAPGENAGGDTDVLEHSSTPAQEGTAVLGSSAAYPANETTPLMPQPSFSAGGVSGETSMLNEASAAPAPSTYAPSNETDLLDREPGGGTELLNNEFVGGTEVLNESAAAAPKQYPIRMLDEVIMIHTDEVIA